MKRMTAFLIMALALALLCLSLTACGGKGDGMQDEDDKTSGCQHQWEETGRVPATCTKAEHIEKKCALCGRTRTEIGNTLPHSLENDVCTVCGYVKPRDVVQDGNLIYVLEGSHYVLSFFDTPSGDIVVADTVDGLPVTALSSATVFRGNTAITSIVFPNIGPITDSMFEGCTGLRSVELGQGVTSVGTRAFYGCTALESVTMTEQVLSIGAAAFGGCGSLKRMVLPFVGSSPNVRLNYRDGWAYYETYYVFGYIFGQSNYNGAKKISVSHDLDPWDKEIYSTFYVPASLAYVEILGGKSFAQGAFDGCSMIRELVLPKHSMGSNLHVFRNCTGVTTLKTGGGFSPATFPNVTSLTLYNVTEKTTFAAADYAKITSLELYYSPSAIMVASAPLDAVRSKITALCLTSPNTAVESGALTALSALHTAAVPFESLGDLDLSAIETLEILSNNPYTVLANTFSGAVKLRELTFNPRCAVIAPNAFRACTTLSRVTFNGNVEQWLSISFGNAYANPLAHGAELYFEAFEGASSAKDLVVPSTVTSIGAYAFYGCKNLQSLTFGKTLTAIAEDAFGGCAALLTVTYRGTVNDWCAISFANGAANPLHCASALMIGGSKQTALGASLSVQKIPAYAFYGYGGLESVALSSTVTHVGASAFENCTALATLSVPAGVTLIEKKAFGGCMALTSALFEVQTGWGRFETTMASGGTALAEYYFVDAARAAQLLVVTYPDYVLKKVG